MRMGLAAAAGAGLLYTNNDLADTTATTLFDIDTTNDQVVLQVPANAGTLSPTGKLGIAAADIYAEKSSSAAIANFGFAAIPPGRPTGSTSWTCPKRISWRMGGMIAAVGSVLLTPWNWYNNDDAIHYTLGILGALIGPLFGVLIAGFYFASKQRIWIDDMFTMDPKARYWFRNGYNPNAVAATLIGGLPAIISVVLPKLLVDLGAVAETSNITVIGNSAGSSAAPSASPPSPCSSGAGR